MIFEPQISTGPAVIHVATCVPVGSNITIYGRKGENDSVISQ